MGGLSFGDLRRANLTLEGKGRERALQVTKRLPSATALACYERCPKQHDFRYAQRIPGSTGSAARVGKLVHGALERACRRRTGRVDPPPIEAEELIESLGAAAAENGVSGPSDMASARELLEKVAPVRLTGEILQVEQRLAVDLGGPAGEWTLVLDLVRRRGDMLEILDWKTGRNPPTDDEAQVDPQIGLYLVAALELHQQEVSRGGEDWVKRIRCVLRYLEDGVDVVVEWAPELDRFVRARCAGFLRALRDQKWARARVGAHCAFCDYRDRCEPFRKLAETPRPDGLQVTEDLSLPELIRERDRMAELSKLSEQRRKDLDEELLIRLEEEGSKTISSGGLTVTRVDRPTPRYSGAVLPVIAEHLGQSPAEVMAKVATVKSGAVRRLCQDAPELYEALAPYRSLSRTSYVRVTNNGGPF